MTELAQFTLVLEQACSGSGDQQQVVAALRQLMLEPEALGIALSILENPASEARTHVLVMFFLHQLLRNFGVERILKAGALGFADRVYSLFWTALQRRRENDTPEAKRDFEILGDVFLPFVREMKKSQPDMPIQRAAPGFELIKSEKLSDVILGIEFLNIMLDSWSRELFLVYQQQIAGVLEGWSKDLVAFAPVFTRLLKAWNRHIKANYRDYLDGFVMKVVFNFLDLLSVACKEQRVIEDVSLLKVIRQAARLLKSSVDCLVELDRRGDEEPLLGRFMEQSLDGIVMALLAVKASVPLNYSSKLLSILLCVLVDKVPIERIEPVLPQLCMAAVDTCVLCEDDLKDHEANPGNFYQVVYPDSFCPASPGHPRRVATVFLRSIAENHLNRLLEVLFTRPPEEPVVYALRVLSKQISAMASAEHWQAVLQYLMTAKHDDASVAMCTWASVVSRFADRLSQDGLVGLSRLALQFVYSCAPHQPNEDLFFFTVGCDVLYHLMKLTSFIPEGECVGVIVHHGESTANGVGMKLLNVLLQPSSQSKEINEQLLILIQRAIDLLNVAMDESSAYSDPDSDKTMAAIDFLGDKAQTSVQLPTDSLCRLYYDRLVRSESVTDLLTLAQCLLRNQHTPDLYKLLQAILEAFKGDTTGGRYGQYGTEIGPAFCCFITHQLRYPEAAQLIPAIIESNMFFLQKAQYIEDFTAHAKVFAALFQAGVAQSELNIIDFIQKSKWWQSDRDVCDLIILEIWASASAFYPEIRMPPEWLAKLVTSIQQGRFCTNYLRYLSVFCLEKHRDCWPAELGALDEILAAVKSASIPTDSQFYEEHDVFYWNSKYMCDMPLQSRKLDTPFEWSDL